MAAPALSLLEQAPPAVVIAHARSRTEERLVRDWAALEHPGASVVRASADHWPTVLDDARPVVPVRVVWNLPAGDEWGAKLSDLVAAPLRRSPWPLLHKPLTKAAPGAAVVVAGDAATVGELRAAHAEKGSGRFADFVMQRALLACDRAERRLAGDRYKVPRLMVEQITASADYLERAERAAARAGDDLDEFLVRARSCLQEMVAVQSPLAIDVFRALTSPLHTKTWDVAVDTERLEQLRAINKDAPLVFLPSHRSYVDPLVVNEVLHRHDFPRNHVLGGDNMSFGPFGPVGKRAGVIFIRRSFGDDAAYKFAMREYLGHLMAKRFNLEWYVEGGRTRTGKLRHPRYGLLRYLVDAMGHDQARDAVLVPTSIMYEQLHEVGAVVAEQTGATKRSEGARWFVRYLRDQSKHIGEARITFGEPFRLREALEEAGPGAAQLEKVAFRICHGINDATPVMTTSVVTFALSSTAGRALTFEQIRAVTAPLLDYLDSRGIAGPHVALRDPDGVRTTLARLVTAGVVDCYEGGEETVWSIPPEQEHVAAFYRNGAVHHLVMRSILELSLLEAERDRVPTDIVEAGTAYPLVLRDLLKFEFFFSGRDSLHDELVREIEIIEPEWASLGAAGTAATHVLDRARTLVAPRALRPIFEAQRTLAELLLDHDPLEPVDKQVLIDRCVKVGRQQLLQGRVRSADSVSRELYSGAYELAAHRSLLEPGPDLVARRTALLAEVDDVLDLLERGARRDAQLTSRLTAGVPDVP